MLISLNKAELLEQGSSLNNTTGAQWPDTPKGGLNTELKRYFMGQTYVASQCVIHNM